MKEEWRPVKGFEGLYEVSDRGRVRSLPRVIARKDGKPMTVSGRMLSAKPNSRGYPRLTLQHQGQAKWASVHRLVADAFLDHPNGEIGCFYGQFVVNHKDGNKENNLPSNLEWISTTENYMHAKREGLLSHHGVANGRSKLNESQIRDIRARYKKGARQVDLAEDFGVDQTNISRIVRGVGYANVA